MPPAERPAPPYVQITNALRQAVTTGQYQPNQRIPTIPELAESWQVAPATAAKAIRQLQVEGLIWTSTQGSFVTDPARVSETPRDQITGLVTHEGLAVEAVVVTGADIVTPMPYIADLLGLEAGEQVIRREEISSLAGRPVKLEVDWIPAPSTDLALNLIEKAPIPGGTINMVERITGRRVVHGRDHIRGRASDHREATALRIPVGAPILAGAHVWSDADGVVLYGEWCLPPDRVISYQYPVDGVD